MARAVPDDRPLPPPLAKPEPPIAAMPRRRKRVAGSSASEPASLERRLAWPAGGDGDAPDTYMHDLVAGQYRLPWEADVKVTDGISCGFATPTRRYGQSFKPAAE